MNKTLEKPFLEAFEFGNVVHDCIDAIGQKYDLGYMPHTNKLSDVWQHHYDVELPKLIRERTDAFDESVICRQPSPLIDEIEANLNECATDASKDRYLFSLLTPFKRFSDIYYPTAVIQSLDKMIADCKKDCSLWEGCKEANGELTDTAKKQIDGCNSMIDRYEKDKARTLYINRRFIEITCTDFSPERSIEYCLSRFISLARIFADRLDALLLTYGIDLMRLQRESGIYLKSHRLISDVDFYIGSSELAQKYIDALPKQDADQPLQTAPEPKPEPPVSTATDLAPELPPELNSDAFRTIISRAIEASLVSVLNGKYHWDGTKRLAAYFADKATVFLRISKMLIGKQPAANWKPFERLFGIANLSECKKYWRKIGLLPKGYEKVDTLFNNLD